MPIHIYNMLYPYIYDELVLSYIHSLISIEPYANPDYIRLNPYIARNLALYGIVVLQINFSLFRVRACCHCNSSQSPVVS